ncbi:MAG: cellulase family glycosylhydrolase, partial [Candidatus Nanopelagicales bacterium]
MRRATSIVSSLAISAAALTGVVLAAPASAHGSLSQPSSRVWECFFGDRNSPMCAAAWQANPQALYDWTEVNQPAANGNHKALIPDGQLCSAGRSKYAAFDTPSTEWKATPLSPDANGKYTLTWESTAPHATRYFRVYVTKPGFDVTKPLKWSDLELVHDTGARPLEATTTMRVEMPARQGRHILYTVWQRSDSPEAFYSCSDVILDSDGTVAPTPTPTPTPTPPATDVAYPLSTSGNRIVDADGDTVIWQGVNWFGLETSNQAPHGLWTRDYKDMLKQIDDLGFNTIRVPFSLQAIRGTTTTGIDYGGGRNADLQGKTPLQVMDAVIAEAGRLGLMVILDNHSQANDGFMDGLWYGQAGFTEDDWVSTWQMLATRYADDDHVVAFDLKNEPHGPATWGTGGATDWRRAAERAGNAVLARNPEVLIVVEGIEGPVAGGQQLTTHWWGGNLEGVRNHPVRLAVANRLVYSPHEYGPGVFNQPWFSAPDMAAALADRWQKGFGYIHEQGIAPIFIGEFGAKSVSPTTLEGRWITQFTAYLKAKGMSWTFWSWNPNSGDTGGILTDDWRTVHEDKMALMRDLMGASTPPPPAPTPPPPPTPTPTPTPTPPTRSARQPAPVS